MSTSLRCLIADDEPLGRHLPTDYVGKVLFLELRAACASPLAALDAPYIVPSTCYFLMCTCPSSRV